MISDFSLVSHFSIIEWIIDQIINNTFCNWFFVPGCEENFYEDSIALIQFELEKLRNKMSILKEDRLDGLIPKEEFRELILKLKDEEEDLIEQIKDHSKGDKNFVINCEYLLELANNAPELFENSKEPKKRELIKFVFSKLEIQRGKLILKTKELFNELLLSHKSSIWLPLASILRKKYYRQIINLEKEIEINLSDSV